MEFQIFVNGEPVTEWEQIRARDVELWKESTRASLGLTDRDVVEAHSRKVGVDAADMTKSEMRAALDAKGITAPTKATRADLIELLTA